MRSLVPNELVWLLIAGCPVSACAPKSIVTQEQVADQSDSIRIDWRQNFYGIQAQGSQGTKLEIQFEPGLEVRATALLVQQGSTWRATTAECRSLTAALEAFRQLPALKPGPAALQPDLSAAGRIPPRPIGDGESWTIRTSAYAPDWSGNEIVLHGVGGPYPFWVGDVVGVIKDCDSSSD